MTPDQRKRAEAAKAAADKQASENRKARKSDSPAGAKAIGNETPPRDPVNIDVYFEPAREKFWTKNAGDEWMPINKTSLDLILRSNWYSQYEKSTNSLTRVESKTLEVMMHHSVKYAGELAGWMPGIKTICGNRVLVTRGPDLPTPKRGKWPLIKNFIAELLGDEGRYFYAWMRAAYQSLSEGAPFAPGQLLAVAGPVGCGKSLLQKLITVMLGGRMAKPYMFFMGYTAFNGDLIGAEHLVLDDEVGKTDIKTRREFGARIKATVANQQVSITYKGRTSFMSEPFWRISLSLNDEPESLMILPPLDEDIADKVILLRARKASVPYPSKELPTMQAYWDALAAEVPAYLHALHGWSIPDEMRDIRFGVKAYQNPDLLFSLSSLSPEHKLWGLIVQSGILSNTLGAWSGSAADLERDLQATSVGKQVTDLLYFPTAAGVFLARLAKSLPDNVEKTIVGKNRTIYHLAGEENSRI